MVFDHSKFINKNVLFSYRNKGYALVCNSARSTIPISHSSSFDNVLKKSISCYMVFVKESKESVCVPSGPKVET